MLNGGWRAASVLVLLAGCGGPERTWTSRSAQALASPAVVCSDPRGCPDLIVSREDLSWGLRVESFTFDASHCTVVEGTAVAGRNRILTFTSSTPNVGAGDLVVGNPAERPDLFETAGCHRHAHFREYADYRLWTPSAYAAWRELREANPGALARDLEAARPDLSAQKIAGHKQGFCLSDTFRDPDAKGPSPRTYDCAVNQGISTGWADVYPFFLDGQWINVTGVAPGDYVLEVEVNAERLFEESDYANNSAAIAVTVPPADPEDPYPPYQSAVPFAN